MLRLPVANTPFVLVRQRLLPVNFAGALLHTQSSVLAEKAAAKPAAKPAAKAAPAKAAAKGGAKIASRDKKAKGEETDKKASPFTKLPTRPEQKNEGWTPQSRRTGVLARKLGMMAVWNEWGQQIPVTVLHMQDVAVVRQLTPQNRGNDNYYALQVAAEIIKPHKINNATKEFYAQRKLEPRREIAEFEVTKEALIPEGVPLNAGHFVPGQLVDIRGRTIGKGFQGAMFRHGFSGLNASHGVSLAHRSLGSTGNRQDPGKVFKGKRMAGHMGHKFRTQQNLLVYKVDIKRNLVYVKGSIPGARKRYMVEITDAIKRPYQFTEAPPFPTYYPPQLDEKSTGEFVAPGGPNPFTESE